MVPDRPLTRRTVLGTVLAGGLSGCLDYLDDGPDCTLSLDRFETDVVETTSVSHTSNNARNDGSCDRSTTTRCVEASLQLDPAAVDRIESRTPEGEVVVERAVDDADFTVELAVLSEGEHAAFDIVLLADDDTIDTASVTIDC